MEGEPEDEVLVDDVDEELRCGRLDDLAHRRLHRWIKARACVVGGGVDTGGDDAGEHESCQMLQIRLPKLDTQMPLRKTGDGHIAVPDEVRELISFKPLNLITAWPMKGPFDAIFCRNVVIYFDEPTQERVWSRFAPLVAPGGRLYVGHSERVGSNITAFESSGLTAYRKVGR